MFFLQEIKVSVSDIKIILYLIFYNLYFLYSNHALIDNHEYMLIFHIIF